MEPKRWRQVEHLYHAVLAREESERAAFLDTACAGDPALRDEVGSLLTYDKRAEHFMEAAPLEAAVKLLAQEQALSPRSAEANSDIIGKTITASSRSSAGAAWGSCIRRKTSAWAGR